MKRRTLPKTISTLEADSKRDEDIARMMAKVEQHLAGQKTERERQWLSGCYYGMTFEVVGAE